ncbi:MAG: glycosyltransferase family 39 protein [Rubrobacter sp.]|nr:glycosyltransferase family 39 protein [Rubrobacter sp.]
MTANRLVLRVRRHIPSLPSRAPAKVSWWNHVALAAILALSAFLNLFRLTSEGYGNVYYAATVKNMLTSWHNFFFASFDASFVSVDKPPLGFWIQAASAKLFGFHGWSLLLPQALAGILSVGLLYHLVRRSFGPVAGLLAALTLALTPISVATNRNNNLESLLVLAVLLAAWSFILAVETGRLRWLLMGALVVGLGFNIKMLEAFLVLPAFYLLYLVAAPVSLRRRIIYLGLATVVLLVVSLSWAAVVDLTPAEQRPYVGSSYNNSVTDLMVGWNGLERLTGTDKNVGDPGPLRLLNQQLAGQIGWLLPLAVVGLVAASWQRRLNLPLSRQHQALVLWGMWFMPQVVFFSVAGDWDPHYLPMLAPAVAALVGVGLVALWQDYQSQGWRGWLLPLTLAGTVGLQAYILALYLDWSHWLPPIIVILCLAAVVSLVVARLIPLLKVSLYPLAAISVGVISLLIAPSIWAASAIWYGAETRTPVAGTLVQHTDSEANPLMIDYLQVNQGSAEYLVAATKSRIAIPIILNTYELVISLGGFGGDDPVFSTDELADLVGEDAVRFLLVQERANKNESASWAQDNCERVPQKLWQSSTSKQVEGSREETVRLYDCSAGAR